MNAIRQIQTVKSGAVTVSLPPEFDMKQVEMVVLPLDEFDGAAQNLQSLLLAAPTLTDAELEGFNQIALEWRIVKKP